MARQWPGESGGGKGRCVGSLWFTLVTIGHLKATVVHIRVILGHLKVTIGNFFYELHPKVRPTCLRITFQILVVGCMSNLRKIMNIWSSTSNYVIL